MLSQFTKSVKKAVNNVVHEASKFVAMKGFSLNEKSSFIAGRNGLYRVVEAVETSTGNPVSIFIFSITEVSRRCADADEVMLLLRQVKHNAAMLTRCRHPGVLRIVKPLTEESNRLWFVTERVETNLPLLMNSGKFNEQEALLGMRLCAETIQFFHERAGIMLTNFCPDAIFVTPDRWKIGDMTHSIDWNQYTRGTLAVPYGLRSLSSPILDYCSWEYVEEVEGTTRAQQTAQRNMSPQSSTAGYGSSQPAVEDLFGGPATSSFGAANSFSGILMPDSDVFSFILVALFILEKKHVYGTAGELVIYKRRKQEVAEIARKWFGGPIARDVLALPRPSLRDVVFHSCLGSEVMQLLEALDSYNTLEINAKLRLLKGLYDKLKATELTEGVVCKRVTPLLVSEFQTEGMPRFVLPLLLMSASVVTTPALFSVHLKPFFAFLFRTLSGPIVPRPAGCAPLPMNLDAMRSTLAQQILEKPECIFPRFSSTENYVDTLVPFFAQTLQENISNSTIVHLTLDCIRLTATDHISTSVSTSTSAMSSSPTEKRSSTAVADALTPRLLAVLAAHPRFSEDVLNILDMIIPHVGTSVRLNAEQQLIALLGGAFVDVDLGDEDSSQEKQQQRRRSRTTRLFALLRQIAKVTARDHKAERSIPLLSPLLVSLTPVVYEGARSLILELMEDLHRAHVQSTAKRPDVSNSTRAFSSDPETIRGNAASYHPAVPQHIDVNFFEGANGTRGSVGGVPLSLPPCGSYSLEADEPPRFRSAPPQNTDDELKDVFGFR